MSINAKIIGIGSYVPERIITNHMLEELMDTSDEWITKRTGIKTRHAVVNDTTSTMAIKASKEALSHAKINADELDMIITSTITADMATPSVSGIVQKELGCKKLVAMDLAAGCTGFIYALATAIAMMDTLNLETALVIGSENFTCRMNWSDRSTCILFGDGAGAVVVKKSKTNCIHSPKLFNIPDTDNVLYMPNGKKDNPWSTGLEVIDTDLKMDGQKVFAFAVDAFLTSLSALDKSSQKPITKIIPHQANKRIISYVAKSSGFGVGKFYVNVNKYANTSSASVPLAMHDAVKENWIKKGDVCALIGFGAGLSYGGIIIEWDI